MVTAVILGGVLLPPTAFPRTQEMKALTKRHSKENKRLKQQQRAMSKVMKQHGQTRESSQRFGHNMKSQRQLAKNNQRQETQRLKEQGK